MGRNSLATVVAQEVERQLGKFHPGIPPDFKVSLSETLNPYLLLVSRLGPSSHGFPRHYWVNAMHTHCHHCKVHACEGSIDAPFTTLGGKGGKRLLTGLSPHAMIGTLRLEVLTFGLIHPRYLVWECVGGH